MDMEHPKDKLITKHSNPVSKMQLQSIDFLRMIMSLDWKLQYHIISAVDWQAEIGKLYLRY